MYITYVDMHISLCNPATGDTPEQEPNIEDVTSGKTGF